MYLTYSQRQKLNLIPKNRVVKILYFSGMTYLFARALWSIFVFDAGSISLKGLVAWIAIYVSLMYILRFTKDVAILRHRKHIKEKAKLKKQAAAMREYMDLKNKYHDNPNIKVLFFTSKDGKLTNYDAIAVDTNKKERKPDKERTEMTCLRTHQYQ